MPKLVFILGPPSEGTQLVLFSMLYVINKLFISEFLESMAEFASGNLGKRNLLNNTFPISVFLNCKSTEKAKKKKKMFRKSLEMNNSENYNHVAQPLLKTQVQIKVMFNQTSQ